MHGLTVSDDNQRALPDLRSDPDVLVAASTDANAARLHLPANIRKDLRGTVLPATEPVQAGGAGMMEMVATGLLTWIWAVLFIAWMSPRHVGQWLADAALAFNEIYKRGPRP